MKRNAKAAAAVFLAAALFCISSCSEKQQEKKTKSVTPASPSVTFAASKEPETTASTVTTTTTPEEEITSEMAQPVGTNFIGKLGTAGELEGTTLIVSIFASDAITSWDMDNSDDMELLRANLTALKTAADWLTERCYEYGKKAKFICDWEEHDDLYARVRFTDTLVRFDSLFYDTQREYIVNEIDSVGLKNKYKADNIIYIFFFNTDYSNQINPWSLTYQVDPMFNIEIINSFVRFKSFDAPPATYAHEILHCFGAYDLYYSSDAIPQSYVDHCKETDSQDIMYTVNSGDEITVILSGLDAYYIGLADHCDLVSEWGLPESEHTIS